MKNVTRDWPALLEEFKGTGLSQRKFCEERGLSLATFTNWRNKLKDYGGVHQGRANQFIQLDVLRGVGGTTAPSTAPNQEELVVELPLGVVMRFRVVKA